MSARERTLLEKIKLVMDIWTNLSLHMRVRDRLVKVIQYGCQMLLGFYGGLVSKEMVEMLSLTRRAASTSRKVFWILKSANHFKFIYEMIEQYQFVRDESFIGLIGIAEQICWVIYYWYENLILAARLKIANFSEEDVDGTCNIYWFVGDVLGFLGSVLATARDLRKMYRIHADYHDKCYMAEHVSDVRRLRSPLSITAVDSLSTDDCSEFSVSRIDKRNHELYKAAMKESFCTFLNNILNVSIMSFELSVSADYVHAWKALLGKEMGDGMVGFCGTAASVLLIAENLIREVRAIK